MKLVLLTGFSDLLPREILISERVISIGRSSICDVVLRDPTISRKQAELTVEKGRLFVRDLESRNGTFVEGEAVESTGNAELTIGGNLQMGRVVFTLRESDFDAHSLDSTTTLGEDADPMLLIHSLTNAQKRVLELLRQGKSEKQIGNILGNSKHTIHNHIRSIYLIFDVHSATELLAKFLPRG